jgi:hypothetical protein
MCLASDGYEFKVGKVANVPPGKNLLVNWTKTAGDETNVSMFIAIINQTWYDFPGYDTPAPDSSHLKLLDSYPANAPEIQAMFLFERYKDGQSGLAYGCVGVACVVAFDFTQPFRWYQVWLESNGTTPNSNETYSWQVLSDWFYFGAEEGSTIPR